MKHWLTALMLVTALGARISAHPVSTTTVSVAVDRSGRFVATITGDADALIAKLDALSAIPLPADSAVAPGQRAARLDALGDALLAGISLEFDSRRSTPQVQPAEISAAGQATIRLIGDVPKDARAMAWASSLVFGSYPVALRGADGRETVVWLQGPERTDAVPIDGPGHTRTVARAIWLGFTHILPNGIDHILFVVGLLLLGSRSRQLLAQVTAFTVAHSMTLALSLYGVFSLPAHVVEPLIALSVAYVGIENLMTSKLQPWRVAVVFCFGLLHGLGFAEALAGLHLSRGDLLATLVSFNVGVEAGQLSVIALAASVLYAATYARATWRPRLVNGASIAIGITGLCWTIQRVF
ncbi:MAG: HupE/UreJ family protein [Acidobacteriota bacterium]